MIRSLLRILVLLAVVGGAAAFWWVRPQPVGVAVLKTGEAAEVVYATGVVEPVHWAAVAPLRRGRIVETCNCEGAHVEEGDLLFRLDASELSARIKELSAQLEFAQRELERAEGLLERHVGTRETVEERIATVNQLTASVAAARSLLSETEIRAPLSGTVLRLDGEVGEVAELGQTLAWVGQPRPMQVVAEVNEEDIPRVRVGQAALILADAFPHKDLTATVDSITPKGDPVLKTYRVYLSLPDDTPLFIGMSVDVNIIVRTVDEAVIAPAPAVTQGAVYVIEDGRARRRPVKTGITGTGTVQIVSGAKAGQRVVSPVPPGLEDGERVRPVETAEP